MSTVEAQGHRDEALQLGTLNREEPKDLNFMLSIYWFISHPGFRVSDSYHTNGLQHYGFFGLIWESPFTVFRHSPLPTEYGLQYKNALKCQSSSWQQLFVNGTWKLASLKSTGLNKSCSFPEWRQVLFNSQWPHGFHTWGEPCTNHCLVKKWSFSIFLMHFMYISVHTSIYTLLYPSSSSLLAVDSKPHTDDHLCQHSFHTAWTLPVCDVTRHITLVTNAGSVQGLRVTHDTGNIISRLKQADLQYVALLCQEIQRFIMYVRVGRKCWGVQLVCTDVFIPTL